MYFHTVSELFLQSYNFIMKRKQNLDSLLNLVYIPLLSDNANSEIQQLY